MKFAIIGYAGMGNFRREKAFERYNAVVSEDFIEFAGMYESEKTGSPVISTEQKHKTTRKRDTGGDIFKKCPFFRAFFIVKIWRSFGMVVLMQGGLKLRRHINLEKLHGLKK